MNSTENLYCRFCAEPRSTEKLLNLQTDAKKQDEIVSKLTLLNAIFVDITNRDSLPKTICFVCYDSLNKAYDFFEGVKRAQHVLSTLFTTENNKYLSDDDAYEDFLATEVVEDISVKVELEKSTEVSNLQVKQEPKEEKESEEFTNSLNVDELIGAALLNSFPSSLTIYAKEVNDVGKRDVVSWSDYPWVCALCSIEFMGLDMLR